MTFLQRQRKRLFNVSKSSLKECESIYDTLINEQNLKHLIVGDIAKEIAEYSVKLRAKCMDCNQPFIISDTDEWTLPKFVTGHEYPTEILYDYQQGLYLYEIKTNSDILSFEVLCNNCSVNRICTDCGALIFHEQAGDYIHCDYHGLCRICADFYEQDLQGIDAHVFHTNCCAKCKFREIFDIIEMLPSFW